MVMLALALMAQVQGDYRFERAVERSVMGFVEWPDYHGSSPPLIVANIDLLGSPCYVCRELAARRLSRAGPPVMRHLYWAEGHPDPEVRLRVRAILERLSRCRDCDGTGECNGFKGQADARRCRACGARRNMHFGASGPDCRSCNVTGYVIPFEATYE